MLDHPSIDTFVAEYSVDAGKSLRSEIVRAIKNCDLFVVIWSSSAQHSDWVAQEIGIAVASEKSILPVVLDPENEPPGFIEELKYLTTHEDPDDALEWLQENIFAKSKKKQQRQGIVWLSIGAAVLWMVSQSE